MIERNLAEGLMLDAVDAILGVEEDNLNFFTSLDENGISDTDKIEILMVIEHEASICIDTEDVESLDSLDELITYVASCEQ